MSRGRQFLEVTEGDRLELRSRRGAIDRFHVFTGPSVHAVNAALAAERPLLVRGEPGVGKSQLARAVAEKLGWAFDWEDAAGQARLVGMLPPQQLNNDDYQRGCVVLIDEIDKAESDVPNGLLEALGDRRFLPLGRSQPIEARDRPLLVMITTNEERTLPDAFLRRCLVLPLELPHETKKRGEFEQLLIDRGDAHFNHRGDDQPQVSATILQEAAEMVADDRADARARHLTPLPGQAEYLDLVRAVDARRPGDEAAQKELLAQIRGFVLKKQLEVQA